MQLKETSSKPGEHFICRGESGVKTVIPQGKWTKHLNPLSKKYKWLVK